MDNTKELFGSAKPEKPQGAEGHRERVRISIDRNPDFSGFADYEMLEYLLFATISRKDTKALAKELIRIFGSLSAVLHADYCELVRVDGVGEKTAHLLANVLPIVLRAESQRFDNGCRLNNAKSAAMYLYSRFWGCTKEKLIMLSLNINDEVIQTDEISEGEVDSMTVDIVKILRTADRNGAKKIILAHNHPGGTMAFSQNDINTTARVISCCMLIGYTFYDHLIFCGNKYLSMFGNDMLSEALEQCDRLCGEFTSAVAKERTMRSVISKLGEKGFESDTNRSKLEILSYYEKILNINSGEREKIISEMFKDV